MEIVYSNEIHLDKELNKLDLFAIEFTSILNKLNIKYVLISGYVAILFGRARNSEDIDIFVDNLDLNKFGLLWNELNAKFGCINCNDLKEAFSNYFSVGESLRFSKNGNSVPNFEMKIVKSSLDRWSLTNRKKIILNGNIMYISPIELQVPFKIFLGSDKDIEDAKHLFILFKEKLDHNLMNIFVRKLKIEELFNKYLK